MTDRERFLELCGNIKREGIDNLIAWIEASDFFTAPASTRFHLSCATGLLKHSLNVYDETKRLLQVYPEIEVSEETVLICTLFHDLCKANFYGTDYRNVKNDRGVWEKKEVYTVNEKLCFGGHGVKSLYIVSYFLKLTPEEASAIAHHMSAFDEKPEVIGTAYNAFPFAWLLSVADQSATYITERES